jgi:hypothetical protein
MANYNKEVSSYTEKGRCTAHVPNPISLKTVLFYLGAMLIQKESEWTGTVDAPTFLYTRGLTKLNSEF